MKKNSEKPLENTPDRKNQLQRLLPVLPLLFALTGSLLVITRELWFDEALTLMSFVLPLTPGEIYISYIIPNNQIVYSIMLNIWTAIADLTGVVTDYVLFWRMLSVIAAMASLILFIQLREKMDKHIFPAVLVLCTMTVSTVFVNYATALRGYAVSWLFVTMALYGLYNIFHGKAAAGWITYILAALLAVGTVPTNLLALAAALLYALPWMQEQFWRDKRFYLAGAVVPLALILFYAPIAGKFLATFKLGEGFATRNGALGMVVGMYIASFGILLLFAPWGIEKKSWQHTLRYMIWLFPAAAILILHKAPFPRVFVTLLPVLAMLVTDGMAKVLEKNWKSWHLVLFFMLSLAIQLMLIPGGVLLSGKYGISDVEDDFFRPYYMAKSYQPCAAALEIKDFANGQPVFFSFNSDPLPMRFYSQINGIDIKRYASDIPYNSVKALPDRTVIVLNETEDPAQFEKRFNCKLTFIKKINRIKLYNAIKAQ